LETGHPLFELRETDRRFYSERIEPYLPPAIFDVHRHLALSEHLATFTPERLEGNWALEVASSESFEQAQLGYSRLFPGRSVSYLAFGWPLRECNLEQNNDYLVQGLRGSSLAGLALTRPEWPGERVAEWLRQSHIIGLKPYYDFVESSQGQEVSIFEFCPHEHLQVLNEVGGLFMLHLPRVERLADPRNIAEVRQIRQQYPNIVMVIAHLGRSYAGRYAREGFRALENEEGILYDTSAVLNPAVYALALDRLGPERLMFGSDLPVLYMRGRRRWEGDRYINLTSGDYAWNVNREPPEVEATYTLYLYEAIAACIDACRGLGFGASEIDAIFHDTARGLVDRLMAAKRSW